MVSFFCVIKFIEEAFCPSIQQVLPFLTHLRDQGHESDEPTDDEHIQASSTKCIWSLHFDGNLMRSIGIMQQAMIDLKRDHLASARMTEYLSE